MLIFLDKWIKYIPSEVSEYFALGNYKCLKHVNITQELMLMRISQLTEINIPVVSAVDFSDHFSYQGNQTALMIEVQHMLKKSLAYFFKQPKNAAAYQVLVAAVQPSVPTTARKLVYS